MKKSFYIVIIAVVAVILGALFLYSNKNTITPTGKDNLIRVTTPVANTVVSSPLVVKGEARGNWYFEASFPVRLLDGEGQELAVGIAQAQGDPATGEVNWMTTEFVPFETTLIFFTPTASQIGTLVLQKDNPSGLSEHDDELRIPVRFQTDLSQTRIIKLYYYNESNDKDASGNLLCSAKGLEAVEREIPLTVTPIQDAVKLLLQGQLTFQEKNRGLDTEFPLAGFSLTGASLNNSSLTLSFADPENKTTGGSCRTGILWAQIEATAKQFSEVSQVKFLPEELFQP